MRQFRTLFGYEMKKICIRKSTWITFVVLILAYLLSVALTWNMTYTSTAQGQDDTGELISEEWQDSYAQKKARERKNGLQWSGRKIDDVLLTDIEKEYSKIMEKAEAVGGAGKQEVFSKEMERIYVLEDALASIAEDGRALLRETYDGEEHNMLTAKKLYEARDINIKEYQTAYGLTEKESSYWQQKENALSKPFIYQYAEGFYQLISMNGIYMVVLFASFLLAVVVSRVFAEEHQRRLDQLILCSRFGRWQLYFIKIAAGMLFAVLATLIMEGINMAVTFVLYGAEGFGAAVQLIAGWYSYPITVGQILFIMLGISVLSALLTSVLIMVVSEKFCSSMAGMTVAIVVTVVVRLVTIPSQFRTLSQVWNYFPINLLKLDQGFLDLRLVSVFGVRMTSWQFATVLYLILGVLLVLLGKRFYCGYQVQGR